VGKCGNVAGTDRRRPIFGHSRVCHPMAPAASTVRGDDPVSASDLHTRTTGRRAAAARPGADLAAALEAAVRDRLGAKRFETWFHQRSKFALGDGRLTVGVPNLHLQEWLQKTFAADIAAAAQSVVGTAVPVEFIIDPELFRAARATEVEVQAPATAPKKAAQREPATGRRWHSFAEFVVGPCNRVACAAALSVVEEPGQHANPLVLYGPVGTGKTHLLEAVYVGLRKGFPDAKVCFITAEDFANRFVQALRLNRTAAFRKLFRAYEALLLDDLHFLATKKASHEEFLHTFDALVSEGKQVVVTTDCHPRLADDFPPELTDRLLGGAVWGLMPPDAETRLALLQAKSAKAQPGVPADVLKYLAGSLRGNVRELDGAVHSLRHFSRVTGRNIDLGLAREALGDLLRHAIRVVRLIDVDQAVCAVLGLPKGTLQTKARAWAVSHPRMLAVFLARKHTAASYSEISVHFGGKSHSTAVAAEKKVRQWLAGDTTLAVGSRPWRVRELLERVEREWQR
jgi:chromosomal replication initiator protein